MINPKSIALALFLSILFLQYLQYFDEQAE
jgi:hypothetical protein